MLVMDYPTAWKFLSETELKDHHEKCSYRTENRGILCDCTVISKEYERRKRLRKIGLL